MSRILLQPDSFLLYELFLLLIKFYLDPSPFSKVPLKLETTVQEEEEEDEQQPALRNVLPMQSSDYSAVRTAVMSKNEGCEGVQSVVDIPLG